MANWVIRNVNANISGITKEFEVSEIFATILANRDILSKRKLVTYLHSDESFFHNALDMKDMEVAFKKLVSVISKNEIICIYGDYDVDGVTSTTILYKGLKEFGANVIYYIPDREEEGYGLNNGAIDYIKEQGVSIILTCDNGIASIEEVFYIKENNMEVIIIDHHEPRFIEVDDKRIEILPSADAIINPKQEKCNYKFKMLSAGGISYKFITEFYKYMEIEISDRFMEYLVFASISTICDIVDLVDENRIIAKNGLKILNQNKNINIGLKHLMKANNIYEKEISEIDYGFIIGPCINASGRLKSAMKAVELFTTSCEKEAEKIALELVELNNSRKEITTVAVNEIIETIENNLCEDKVIVIYNDKIHESVAGIVAGRVKEKYYKPTFIITKSKNGAKGSGRGIPCYDMFDELMNCAGLFDRFGGHKMAAGLSLPIENIDKFRTLINKNCNLTENDITETITIDKAITFEQANINLIEELQSMKPIGKDNRAAVFATKEVVAQNVFFIGKEKRIIKLSFLDNTGNILNAITFDGYDKFINILKDSVKSEDFEKIVSGMKKTISLKLDIVYFLEINSFNGSSSIQLRLKDFRAS